MRVLGIAARKLHIRNPPFPSAAPAGGPHRALGKPAIAKPAKPQRTRTDSLLHAHTQSPFAIPGAKRRGSMRDADTAPMQRHCAHSGGVVSHGAEEARQSGQTAGRGLHCPRTALELVLQC